MTNSKTAVQSSHRVKVNILHKLRVEGVQGRYLGFTLFCISFLSFYCFILMKNKYGGGNLS